MAFPAVQGTPSESSTNTAGTSHVVTLPSGIQAGELLVVFIDKGSTAATFNALAGWTELLDENLANGIAILYRWADGTEGASITLTSSASTRSARIAYRVSGAENPGTTPPTLGTVGTGTSVSPNPGNCNPGSAKDYLWFTFFGGAGEEADDDTWCNSPPSGYSNLLQKACGTAGTNLGGKIAVAYKQANAASDDAGTFSQDVSTAWRAYTVAIHPPAGGGTVHNVSVSEAATAADAPSAGMVTNVSRSEAVTADDSVSGGLLIAVSVSEGVSAGDQVGGGLLISVSVSESVSAADALSAIATLIASISEAVSAADQADGGVVIDVSIGEAAAAGDQASGGLLISVSVTEPVSPGGGPATGGGAWGWVG